MRKALLSALLLAALPAPATADSYPVSGSWGQNTGSEPGAIDCSNKRVIAFNGNQRTDSGGAVHAFRNKSVTPTSPTSYRVVDWFSNGLVRNGTVQTDLRKIDGDHVQFGALKLQRCQ